MTLVAARLRTWHGEPAVTLAAGDLEATFLPTVSMLGVSLRHRGDELLAPVKPLAQYRRGRVTGIPFLFPWANRLAGPTYRVGRKRVTVARDVHTDGHGLPIHGTVAGVPFDVVRLDGGPLDRGRLDRGRLDGGRLDGGRLDGVRLVAQLDTTRHAAISRSFPFAQHVELDAQLGSTSLAITTTVHAAAKATSPSPVSFGFHPYFRLPGATRAATRLRLPPRRHIALDERQLPDPAKAWTHEPADDQLIAHRTFDDHYALGRDRRFELATRRHSLTITFDRGYPYAQVFAPPRAQFVCIEPMVAPVNGLVTGDAPLLAPGDRYRATFTVTIATP